jgi:hypothetical protein
VAVPPILPRESDREQKFSNVAVGYYRSQDLGFD